jgi:hypothetical protein
MINSADSFISPKRNRKRIKPTNVERTIHKQPLAADRTLDAVMKIRRRATEQENGFDAVGVTMIRCANDRTPVVIDYCALCLVHPAHRPPLRHEVQRDLGAAIRCRRKREAC